MYEQVLLEDIDAAFVQRRAGDPNRGGGVSFSGMVSVIYCLDVLFLSERRLYTNVCTNLPSLSVPSPAPALSAGLLNAIDGVGSGEQRVVFMCVVFLPSLFMQNRNSCL